MKEAAGIYKSNTTETVCNGNGKFITDTNRQINTFKKYTSELFEDNEDCTDNQPITTEEVATQIPRLKNDKACGPGDLSAEFLELLDTESIRQITQLFNGTLLENYLPHG